MCLSIPSRVLSIDENNYAIVETLGVKRGVSLRWRKSTLSMLWRA